MFSRPVLFFPSSLARDPRPAAASANSPARRVRLHCGGGACSCWTDCAARRALTSEAEARRGEAREGEGKRFAVHCPRRTHLQLSRTCWVTEPFVLFRQKPQPFLRPAIASFASFFALLFSLFFSLLLLFFSSFERCAYRLRGSTSQRLVFWRLDAGRAHLAARHSRQGASFSSSLAAGACEDGPSR